MQEENEDDDILISTESNVYLENTINILKEREHTPRSPAAKNNSIIIHSCYARSILSKHIFKLLPSNLVRSKD